jgi:cell division protein FtsB
MSEPPLPARAVDKDEVADRVREVLRDSYKDSRYIELATAEAIATRLMTWAKLFGFYAGIPLALIALWLGWLGYKSSSDVSQLEKEITKLRENVASKQAQLAKLDELDKIDERVNALSTRVASLEAVKFTGSATVAEPAKKQIAGMLARYQQHFAELGSAFAPNQEVNVQFEKSELMKPPGQIAFYDGATNSMIVDEKYVASDDVILREYAHRILLRANNATSGNDAMALESGLADYYSRSFAGSPAYTSFPARTLANDEKVFIARDYADVQTIGLAWGGLGWDLRQKLGRDIADALLFTAWTNTPRGPAIAGDFARAIINTDAAHNGGRNADLIRTLLAKRGVSI